jgi:hypothetical protein
VPAGKWITTCLPILYALPLLWRNFSSSTSIDSEGARTIVSGGYGHELSSWVFLFAVVGLLLWQVTLRLHADSSDGHAPAGQGWIRT